MSTSVTFNGSSYSVPATGERAWGTSLSSYLVAIASGALSKAGGSFTLTADVDFGATYGLKGVKFASRNTPATAGIFRLGNAESVAWRNAANSADLALKVNASNVLEFNSVALVDLSSTQTLTTKTIVVADNTITTAASGNLAATELNAALAELQGDIDSRATSTALTTHTGDTSNPHSVTANQVLPSQTSNGGKVLQTDGSNTSWVSVATTDSQPPVGSIVAYNPGYYTGAANAGFTVVGPSGNTVSDVNTYLPTNWRVCDGSALDDASSPIWVGAGRYLPDISDSRFLMGSTSAGATGGSNSSAHTHSVPAHYHGMGTGADLNITASGSHNHLISKYKDRALTSANPGAGYLAKGDSSGNTITSSVPSDGMDSQTHTHASGNFSGSIGLVTGGVDGNAAMTSGAASATENRPAYLSTFYIVRVK